MVAAHIGYRILQHIVVRHTSLRKDSVDGQLREPRGRAIRDVGDLNTLRCPRERVLWIEREGQLDAVVSEAYFIGHCRRENMCLRDQSILVLILSARDHIRKVSAQKATRRRLVEIGEIAYRELVVVADLVIDAKLRLKVGECLRE